MLLRASVIYRLGVAAALTMATSLAQAAPYTALYAFGDSLSDAGNIYAATGGAQPVSPPYSQGRYTNGPVWVQDLAASLGLGPITPSLTGGTDYAYGGAQTGTTPVHTANPTDLSAQLTQFQGAVPHPAASALYTLWIGANDLFTILGTPQITPAAAIIDANAAIANVATFVSGLAKDGAKTLVLVTVPDLGKVPDITAQGVAASAAASQLSAYFDQALVSTVDGIASATGMTLDIVNSYAVIDAAVANPSAYGYSNVTAPCWTGNFTDPASGTVCASSEAAQNQYLFWDGVHPTASGHQIIATLAAQEVPEPASMSLLALGLAGLGAVRRRRS